MFAKVIIDALVIGSASIELASTARRRPLTKPRTFDHIVSDFDLHRPVSGLDVLVNARALAPQASLSKAARKRI